MGANWGAYKVAATEVDRNMARSLQADSNQNLPEEDRIVMQEARYLGRLEPGMDVCDLDGTKVGSISRVYRHELVGAGASSTTSDGGSLPREELIEVKTGLLGLGKHLYVPFSAIQDVTSGCVFVNVSKEQLDDQGWDVKPDYLDDLS